MIPFLARRWFLIALFLAIGIGLSLHAAPLANALASWTLFRNIMVAAVMFVMALPLEASAMWRALRRPIAPGLASVINFGLIPPAAFGLSLLLPPDLAAGLIVAGATPCTLASAAVWTRKAGGNDAAAILVTILTNSSCFLVTPLWVLWLTGEQAGESIQLGPMVLKLGAIVVGPMALAQLIRLRKRIADWATERKGQLSILAQSGILTMVFLGSIRTGQRLFGADSSGVPYGQLVVMVGLVLALHLAAFAVGWVSSPFFGLKREDQIAVSFAGSQKTLMVGLQVSMDLGVSILPMITYHVGQLIVDTLLAERIRDGEGEGERG